jgi:hypothetical protein
LMQCCFVVLCAFPCGFNCVPPQTRCIFYIHCRSLAALCEQPLFILFVLAVVPS